MSRAYEWINWTSAPRSINDMYRVFIKYCVFSLKCSELYQFCCRAGVLPAWCVYTDWHRGKTEKGQSPEYILKFSKKTTIFNEHSVLAVVECSHASDSLFLAIKVDNLKK